jgi:hypothetical protein
VLAFLNSKWSSYSNEQKLRNYLLSKITFRNLKQELDLNKDTYILMPQLPACEAKSSVLVNFLENLNYFFKGKIIIEEITWERLTG